MIPNPIHKVLSTLSSHAVKHLLMGGQACVFYGAAEFSRDCDIVILAESPNFGQLEAALNELQASCIAVPPFDWQYLDRGHALHFRCQHPEAAGIRLDVMSKMRGCDDFTILWERRTTIEFDDGIRFELLGIEDLVLAKKTQRDKDWPMIRRLVDAHYEQFCNEPTNDRVRFWLRESRTPAILVAVSKKHADLSQEATERRPLLAMATKGGETELSRLLAIEQAREAEADRAYWEPIKQELEQLRFNRQENR